MPLTTRVTNDYNNWTADALWVLYDSNTKCEAVSPDDVSYNVVEIKKSFALTNPAHASALSFTVKHFLDSVIYGTMQCSIVLEKPDSSQVSIYSSADQETAFILALDAADITSHLTQTGTYYLILRATVQSEYASALWWHAEVHGSTVLLEVDDTKPSKILNLVCTPVSTSEIECIWDADSEATQYHVYYKKISDSSWSYVIVYSPYALLAGLLSPQTYDIKVAGYNLSGEGEASDTTQQRTICTLTQDLSDTTTPTEDFAKNRIAVQYFQEAADPTEAFNAQVFSTTPTSTIILLCGYNSNKIYTFEPGLVAGHFDTPEVTFGYPDKEKILSEIRFGSEAEIAHTLIVYVSVDSGASWSEIGSDTCGLGKTGFVYPWLTSNKFLIRFSGSGLYLYFYELYAVPSGWKVRTT